MTILGFHVCKISVESIKNRATVNEMSEIIQSHELSYDHALTVEEIFEVVDEPLVYSTSASDVIADRFLTTVYNRVKIAAPARHKVGDDHSLLLFVIRDKIACTQFVSVLSDEFVRRILQMDNIVKDSNRKKEGN
ncbi:hypothetical protein ALC53_08074 [Atta colombica]|uniref:Uncharacterized protein n=1 Tax=Atta colombica TaxID=520822 RepID=A0A151I2R6_9HYME|nr:hypothetical protein ALC53_08074 [Atta colombica]